MSRIPPAFIDELLSRVDIVDLIDARVPLQKRGGLYKACCPFHSEKSPSFVVYPDGQNYHCFGCGAHGSAIGFQMEYERAAFRDAVVELASRAGLSLPADERGNPARAVRADAENAALYAALERSNRWYRDQLRAHPQAQRAAAWLKRRGVSDESVAEFQLGFAPPGWDGLAQTLAASASASAERFPPALLQRAGLLGARKNGEFYDRFRDRILFPIFNARGRVVGFGGRALSDDGEAPKYINSPESPLFHKGRELYGLHQARAAMRRGRPERMLVVEGYMDVVMLAQHGLRGVVAVLGSAVTAEHIRILFRLAPRIVFCFDGDRAGREAARKALAMTLPEMRGEREAAFLALPEGEDPDSLVRAEGREAFEERIGRALSLSEALFADLEARADLNSLDGRARCVELARPLFAALPPGPFRELMHQELARRAGMQQETLLRVLQRRPPPRSLSRPQPQRPGRELTLSPARLALALLIRRGELAAHVAETDWLRELELPGGALLARMIDILHDNPRLTFAALLERWRDAEEYESVARMAHWRPALPAEGVEQEFLDAIARLRAFYEEQRREGRYRRLLQKAEANGLTSLSAEERREYARYFHREAGTAGRAARI